MNCKDLKELLSAYVDGELSRTQREFIEEHLAVCADCKATLEGYRVVNQKLTSLREVPAMPDRKGAIMSRIKDMSNRPGRRWLRPALAAIPIVAILIALTVLQPWSSFTGTQSVMAKAYAATAGLQSYRMSVFSSSTSGGRTFEQNSEWEFAAPDRWHQKFTLDGRAYEIISIGDRRYIRDPADGRLVVGAWSPTVPSKEETLEILASLVDLKRLPEENIGGTDCLHYKGRVDMDRRVDEIKAKMDPNDPRYEETLKQVEEMRSIRTEVELWIGKEDYLIRKWQQETSLPEVKSESVRLYYDFNEPITIEPPVNASGELLAGWRLQDTFPAVPPAGQPPYPTKIPPSQEQLAPYLAVRQKVDFPIGMPTYIPDGMWLENTDIMDMPGGTKIVRFLYGKQSLSQHIKLSQSRFETEKKAERDRMFENAGFSKVQVQGVTGYWRQGVLAQTDIKDPSTQYWDMTQIELWWDVGDKSYTIYAKNVPLEELVAFADSMVKID